MLRQHTALMLLMPFVGTICFHRSRPDQVASLASGLRVPTTARLVTYHRELMPDRGHAYAHLELALDSSEFASLLVEAKGLRYRQLLSDSNATRLARQHLLMDSAGYFRFEEGVTRGAFTLVVLDTARYHMGVFMMGI